MTKEYKGFLDEAIKLGAEARSVQITIPNKETYKIGDNYIGVSAEFMLEFGLPKGDAEKIHATVASLHAYVYAVVEESLRIQKETKNIQLAIEGAVTPASPLKLEQAATVAETPPPAAPSIASTPTEAPPQPPEAPQASGPVESHEILKDCSISHQVTGSGIHHLLVKGGKFSKYGVKMWPEKASEFISALWTEWEIGKMYTLPEGYQEAVVQLKADGKPDRVIGLR